MAIQKPKTSDKGGRYAECIEALEKEIHLLMDNAIEQGWTKGEIHMALVRCGLSHPGPNHGAEFDDWTPRSGGKH